MIGSILVRMPVITREFDEEIGVEIINKYFVRFKGDVYIPMFNLPLLNPMAFRESVGRQMMYKLIGVTFNYYKEYLELRKQKQFNVKVFLPEKYGGNALYYLLQKFMIGEATPKEIKIIREFLSRDIFDGKSVHMVELLEQYYMSILMYDKYDESIHINTLVGVTPLYVSRGLLITDGHILGTRLKHYKHIAFMNVLASYFFTKGVQIGTTNFKLLKYFEEPDLNWDNVEVISFKELYDIYDAIIDNNLDMSHPEASFDLYRDVKNCKDVFLSHSPILSVVGNAIDFKNKSVMFLFAMLKRRYDNTSLIQLNNIFGLCREGVIFGNKNIKYFVISVPFKNIKKFIYRMRTSDGVFIIEENGKTIPVLSIDVGSHWVGVGRENTIIRYSDCYGWYKLLRKLATKKRLVEARNKTLKWLTGKDYLFM